MGAGGPVKKVLVSACLLGDVVRFDGRVLGSDGERVDEHPAPGNAILERWLREGRVVRVCPEVAGGLPVPRPPAERQADGAVRTKTGLDVTAHFAAGAEAALRLVREHGISLAVMKEGSPSCGSGYVYDGSFTKTRVPGGEGETVRLLRAHGVQVFSEHEWTAAERALRGDVA